MWRPIAVIVAVVISASPGVADAFCGFYVGGANAKLFNNATQVVLMRDGTRTVLSMRNNYQGPPENFAMVVPVPTVLQKENVKTLPNSIFDRVDKLASPRLVEYWEQDPCAPPRRYKRVKTKKRSSRARKGEVAKPRDYRVKIEAEFVVGEYEIVILSAEDSNGLYGWLKDSGYKIPENSEKVLRPYVASGMKFFVAKVDIRKLQYDQSGRTMLSPLRFHYDAETFSLPVRLGLLNSRGTQDLIVHILARGQRYEVANYKNVTIPTNLRVRNRTLKNFGRFYASLFDETIRRNPGAVVTEYAWQAAKCDPCPGPDAALQPNELHTLGADVLGGSSGNPNVIAGGSPSRVKRRSRRRVRRGNNFVLTRLHARYKKNSLGDDLIFQAAPPIAGGREFYVSGRKLEQGAQSSSVNNFQGRYIIRHRWRGKVACQNPRYKVWGGPPRHVLRKRAKAGFATAATDLGLIKRRKVNLRRYLLQSVPEVGVRFKRKGKPAPNK